RRWRSVEGLDAVHPGSKGVALGAVGTGGGFLGTGGVYSAGTGRYVVGRASMTGPVPGSAPVAVSGEGSYVNAAFEATTSSA
ncbi:hypothetical protein HK101_005683, partial [Irineochytrium annulatum]